MQNFKGTRDYFGQQAIKRQQLVEKIKSSLETFGFQPLETPILERMDTLEGKYGQDAENLIFQLGEPHDYGGLRYDHTVPLARFVSKSWQDLPHPYKRYAVGPVFRAESPQAGRYRQFTQIDFDILDSKSNLEDSELLSLVDQIMISIGFGNEYEIKINDRQILNIIIETSGFNKGQVIPVIRALDKLDKKEKTEVAKTLSSEIASQKRQDQNIQKKFIHLVDKLNSLKGDNSSKIESLLDIFDSAKLDQKASEFQNILQNAVSFGANPKSLVFSPSLARGLNYYTGIIYEVVVKTAKIGSIGGGGRYDNLIKKMGGPSLCATGGSFGLERLMFVVEKLDSLQLGTPRSVFVTIFPKARESFDYSTNILRALRQNNIAAQINLQGQTSLSKQMRIAAANGARFVVIAGPDEMQKNSFIVRDMESGEEKSYSLEKVKDLAFSLSV